MRIRRRLVLYAAAVATVGVTLFGVLLMSLAARGVATDQDALLAKVAGDTAAAAEAIPADELAARRPLVPTDLATSTEPFVVLLSGDGRVLYSTGLLGGAPPRIPAAVVVEAADTGSSTASIHPAGWPELRVVARPWERGGATGVAVAAQATTFTENQLAGLRFLLLFSGLITVIVVVIVSWLVIGRALRPLKTLAATADEIGRTGDLGRRLPPARTRDEVGTLTASFNGMLDRLGATQAQLEESLAAQRRFVADASHELRTPLTTIRTNAEFLREHPSAAQADRTEGIADIAAEAQRMSGLVEGLLTLARVDAGGTFERRPVDLAAVAAEVARKAGRNEAGRTEVGRPIRIETSGAVVVSGDPEALTRVVWILVDNALRHGAGAVELAVAASDGRAVLTVADRGLGIPSGQEQRVFERFHRADPARSGGGAGLGLAIASSIVQAQGGTITAENRPDGGAILRVELPLEVGAAPGT